MHINAFWCIFNIFIAFHRNAFFTCCMVLHIFAFIRIHVWCILILMHLLTFIRIFNAAFGTRCIHAHLNAFYYGCIFLACCILVHSLHKMHSCAFFVCVAFYTCRILTHSNTFSAWCILNVLHSTCDAFRCIIMYSSALRRKNTRFRWAPGRDLTSFMMLKNAHECTWMHKNASECTRIHQGPHTYLHKRSRSGLKAKLTWTDMWAGRAVGVP